MSTENKQTTSGGDSVTNLIEGLSRRAEAALSQRAGPSPKAFAALSPEAAQQLLHDLQVHQIELEMQNQELRRTQAELDTSRSHYFDFYDLAPVGYCTLSESGLILQANLKTTTMLGVAKKDLPSRTLSRFIFAEDQDHFYRLRQLAMASRDLQECEVRLVKQDGTQMWVRLQAQVIDGGGMQHLGLVLTDITSYKQLQRELRAANEELARQSESRYRTPIDVEVQSERLRLLYEASQRLSSTLDLNEIYRIIDDFMSAIAPDCDFLVSAFDPDTQLITCRAFVMNGQALDVSAFPPIPLEEEGRGTQSLVIRSGKPLLLNDYQAAIKTARTSYFVNDQTHELDEQVDPEEEVPQSALIVPLKVGDRVTGVVQVMSYRLNAFSEEQLQLLESLALHIAVAKQNAQLYARVQSELEQRKQAEAELRESETSLNEAQALALIGSYVTNIETGIWQASVTLRQIFGIDSSFVTSVENWGKLMAPGYQQKMLDYYQSVVEGDGKFDMEYEVIRPSDGQRRWVHALGRLVYDGNGKPVFLKGTIQDITERKLTEESQRIAAVAFDSQQAMFITNPQQLILRINKGFSEITGYTAEEAVGQTPRLLSSGKHGADFYAAMWECVSRTGQWHGEIWNRRKNGTIYPQQLTISTVKNAQGLLTHYVGAFSDITSARAAEEQIESLAYSDLLTGLPNRRRLIIQLQQAMIAGENEKRQGALLLVDLDRFKSLNDAIGHAQGDEVLQRAAKRLSAAVRDGDTVARLGGDEFVVLLDHLNLDPQIALRQAQTVANKMLESLNKPYHLAGSTNSCTASIGITFFGEQYEDTLEPLKRAELAMYQAKSGGRNMLRFFDPQMQAVVDSRVKLEAALQEAIQNQQFTLYYQAQVSDSEGIVGVEALVRWFDPKRGMVSPAEFIPLAEETGLILPIGSWVLETACQQLAAWADQPAMAHLCIAVNVSARQFRESNFVSQTLATLERTRANPQRLKLELTESVLIADAEDVIVKMNALKAIGIGFAIDDFGTGYSSLSYLKRLPLERLKIDQGFVRNILMDPDDAAISRAVIAMATSMGLGVIAEGVETEAQRDFLASLGCHTYQGYLFSKPLPVADFEAFATRF